MNYNYFNLQDWDINIDNIINIYVNDIIITERKAIEYYKDSIHICMKNNDWSGVVNKYILTDVRNVPFF